MNDCNAEHQQLVDDCEAREQRLSDWERGFVDRHESPPGQRPGAHRHPGLQAGGSLEPRHRERMNQVHQHQSVINVVGEGSLEDMGRETINAVHADMVSKLGAEKAGRVLVGMHDAVARLLMSDQGPAAIAAFSMRDASPDQLGRQVVEQTCKAVLEHEGPVQAMLMVAGALAASVMRYVELSDIERGQALLREMADSLPVIMRSRTPAAGEQKVQ